MLLRTITHCSNNHTVRYSTQQCGMIIRTMCYRFQKHEIYFSSCGKNKLCNDGQPARYHPSPFFPFSFSSFFLFFYVPLILSILHHFHLLYLHFFPSFLFPFFLFFFSTFLILTLHSCDVKCNQIEQNRIEQKRFNKIK